MDNWRLSKEEYQVLLAYIGCGDIRNADIIFFGNEEGTGGYSVTANVNARVKYYGKKTESEEKIHCIERGDWEKGFFHPDAQGGASLVEKCLLQHESVRPHEFTAGVFNSTVARLCLAYEQSGVHNWFEGSQNNNAFNAIKEYISKQLYKVREVGIQTALVDWRPLPRPNESVWPKEYGNVAQSPEDKPAKDNPYLAVFDKPKSKYKPEKYSTSSFSHFQNDMLFRASIIKNAFIKSKAKIIIGIGGAGGFKKDAFELMFGNNTFKPIEFSADMRNSKGQVQKAFHGEVSLEHKNLHIFLIPFPTQGQGFPTQEHALQMLEELYDKYVKSILASSFLQS